MVQGRVRTGHKTSGQAERARSGCFDGYELGAVGFAPVAVFAIDSHRFESDRQLSEPVGGRERLDGFVDRLRQAHYGYVLFHRTAVTNNTDRPIRIVWFDAFLSYDGEAW
jgi:hypothetical protein